MSETEQTKGVKKEYLMCKKCKTIKQEKEFENNKEWMCDKCRKEYYEKRILNITNVSSM